MLYRYNNFRNSVEIKTCLLLQKTECVFYICEKGESRKELVKIKELKSCMAVVGQYWISQHTLRKETRPLSGNLCMHPVL